MGRILVVIAAVIVSAASASSPKQHAVKSTTDVKATYDATWAALIDLFSERGWTIQNMDKSSGLIVTDWMKISGDHYVDCGSAPLASDVATRIRFNVRVKPSGSATSVAVNAAFQRLRQLGDQSAVIDCASKGTVEGEIHREVTRRAELAEVRTAEQAAKTFFCTAAPADATIGWCARSEAGCSKRQADIIQIAGDASPCEKADRAVCFGGTSTDGVRTESCHPSAEACAKQLERAQLTDITTCK